MKETEVFISVSGISILYPKALEIEWYFQFFPYIITL